jgi:hypothetical protein
MGVPGATVTISIDAAGHIEIEINGTGAANAANKERLFASSSTLSKLNRGHPDKGGPFFPFTWSSSLNSESLFARNLVQSEY